MQNNPYLVEHFIGHKEYHEKIIHFNSKQLPDNIYIRGVPGIGKTCFLKQLQQSITFPLIPIYIPLQNNESDVNQQELDILQMIYKTLIQRNVITNHIEKLTNFWDGRENLHRLIVQQAPNIKLILLLDNFDSLYINNERNWELINNHFKAFSETRTDSIFNFIVSGTPFYRSDSFFLTSMFSYRLRPLSETDIETIILHPLEKNRITYDVKAVQKIKLLCGGFPLYCKTLCYHSYENAQKTNRIIIDLDDIEVAEKIVIQRLQDHYYLGFWKYLDNDQRQFVSALAHKHRFLPRIFNGKILELINKYELIQEISNHSIVSSSKYRFSADLFRIWTLMISL